MLYIAVAGYATLESHIIPVARLAFNNGDFIEKMTANSTPGNLKKALCPRFRSLHGLTLVSLTAGTMAQVHSCQLLGHPHQDSWAKIYASAGLVSA